MSSSSGLQPDPSMIGRLVKPVFAVLPDPTALFRQRAERFAVLAEGHDLAPYLRFLGALSAVQADLVACLPAPDAVPPEQVERARANAMPPLDRGALGASEDFRATLVRFLEAAASVEMPAPAAAALAELHQAPRTALGEMIGNVMGDAIPFEMLAQHLFLSAATQVHAARLAATLEADKLVPLETGLCPVCGGPPASSVVVGVQGAEGARYAACAFCGTRWNEVRIKCLACGSTKGVGYKSAGTENATVKAECCDSCRSWVKILYADRNPALEAVADDVASLGLDLLMQNTEYRRAGFDPFLIGY
ncbi:formate dehydrogenase accessory protein FdhE [Teichococcus vastitatis]|uniref:Protein FdhE homolog n=1 Tax=Teichococcus vastitatis TaxID=2307076 RepID=A0ABS9WBU4_9PROT|nr:formate dehydrogenase accessory protein FdhE [Pseudoroseomonas vastitatis]MCI0756764.1 formate dehydrogenase accessory protein FdhE [Pseudoroseomonas vastitatis]